MLGFYVVTKAMGILRHRCDGCGFSQQSWVSAVKRDGTPITNHYHKLCTMCKATGGIGATVVALGLSWAFTVVGGLSGGATPIPVSRTLIMFSNYLPGCCLNNADLPCSPNLQPVRTSDTGRYADVDSDAGDDANAYADGKNTNLEMEQGLGWQIGVFGFHSPFLQRTFDLSAQQISKSEKKKTKKKTKTKTKTKTWYLASILPSYNGPLTCVHNMVEKLRRILLFT